MKPQTLDELESGLTTFLEACRQIREIGNEKYGFHFYDNYDEFGMTGFLVNHNEITQRMKSFEKRLRELPERDRDELFRTHKKSLENMLFDDINYCLLFLFWLSREKWPRCHTFSESGTKSHTYVPLQNIRPTSSESNLIYSDSSGNLRTVPASDSYLNKPTSDEKKTFGGRTIKGEPVCGLKGTLISVRPIFKMGSDKEETEENLRKLKPLVKKILEEDFAHWR